MTFFPKRMRRVPFVLSLTVYWGRIFESASMRGLVDELADGVQGRGGFTLFHFANGTWLPGRFLCLNLMGPT